MFKVMMKNNKNVFKPITVYGVRQTGDILYFLFYDKNNGWFWDNSEYFIPWEDSSEYKEMNKVFLNANYGKFVQRPNKAKKKKGR